MLKPSGKISFVCFLLICVGQILISIRFLSASQILDYHQIAMGISWNNLSVGMQTMSLNFLRAAGLGFLIAGLAMFIILAIPFRKGEQWSKWALFSIGMTQAIIMAAIISSVRMHTPATPPAAPFVISAILSLIGVLTYQSDRQVTSQPELDQCKS